MPAFAKDIERYEAEMQARKMRLRDAVAHRHQSPEQRAAWEAAARDFFAALPPVDALIGESLRSGALKDPRLRTFVFDYIDHDPFFHRSGYIMGDLLQRVKKLSLTQAEQSSLQNLILKRIDTRALRNFRRICRLIPMIDSPQFHARVSNRAASPDPMVRRRADFALAYFPINGRLRDQSATSNR